MLFCYQLDRYRVALGTSGRTIAQPLLPAQVISSFSSVRVEAPQLPPPPSLLASFSPLSVSPPAQVISTFSTGKIPYVVRLNPDDDKQDTLLAGMSDKKIMQWDMRTGEITQVWGTSTESLFFLTLVFSNPCVLWICWLRAYRVRQSRKAAQKRLLGSEP